MTYLPPMLPPSVARKCHDFGTDLVALKRCEVREVGVKYP